MTTATVPVEFNEPVNAAILAVSEDQLEGFQRDPLGEIARRSGVDLDTVVERVREMLRAGTIRRVRQTLLSTNLAPGALVAWQVPQDRGSRAASRGLKWAGGAPCARSGRAQYSSRKLSTGSVCRAWR